MPGDQGWSKSHNSLSSAAGTVPASLPALLLFCDEYQAQGKSFAIETTLASRSLAPRVRRLQAVGYEFHLLLFWLNTPELNIQRVAERVRKGGHHIPEDVIRRRYVAGLKNFFSLYMPLADVWAAYDNSIKGRVKVIATGRRTSVDALEIPQSWGKMKEIADNE